MSPLATAFGAVSLPPTDPRYVNGAPGIGVPSVVGLNFEAAKQRIKAAGFQVSDQPTPINSTAVQGSIVGTTPTGAVFPGSIITINTSNGIAPAPPPVYRAPAAGNDIGGGGDYVPPPPPADAPPPEFNVIEIPGLPPITIPAMAPPPQPAPAPAPAPAPLPQPAPPIPEAPPPPPGDVPPP